MDVKIIKQDQKEYVAGAVMAVLLGKIQTAPPAETVALSGELMKWYRIMWPMGHSPAMENVLQTVSTKELVEELRDRVGVDATMVEPYKIEKFAVEGPCIVLVVRD